MDQIRTLLWLKTRLTLARYRQRKSLLASLLLTLPLVLAFNGALFYGGLVAFGTLPLENSRQILNGALTAVYGMWMMGPLLGVSLNEGYDISKLLPFPVSGRRIFIANILGSVLDPAVLYIVIPFASIPIGLATGPGHAVLITGVLLLFLFHMVSLSQALMTLTWGLLKSRRVADLWKVMAALAGTIIGIGYQVLIRRMNTIGPALLAARPSRFTRFLPSGLTADAVIAIQRGATGAVAWRVGLLAIICAVTVMLAGSLVQRVTSGDLVLDRTGMATPQQRPKVRSTGRLPAWISPEMAAVFQNEMRIFMRDPQAKVELLRHTGGLIMVPIVMLTSSHSEVTVADLHRVGILLLLGPMGAMMLLMLAQSSNILARDRNGLSLLCTMPAPRAAILFGKNAAMLTVFSPLCAVIVTVMAGLAGLWTWLVPALVITECLMVLSAAEGNLFSVYHPTPPPDRGANPYTTGSGAFPLGCLGAVAAFAGFAVVAAPLVPAFLAPALWIKPHWYLATLPAAILYSAWGYRLATCWAARALTRREPEILQVILRMPA